MTDSFDVELCLCTDPFEGDFGDQGDVIFKDKIAVTRKDHECHDCSELIPAGSRVRYMVAKMDGDLMSFRWCWKCCRLMAAPGDDGDDDDLHAPQTGEQ